MPRKKRGRKASTVENPDDLTKAEQVCEELRKIQWKTNCSTQTLQYLLNSLNGKLGELCISLDGDLPRKATAADQKMQNLVIRIIIAFLFHFSA